MANREYIDRLRLVISHMHKAGSTWVESVPVHEVFHGQTVWQGTVEVFDITGHPKAKRCYAWSHFEGADNQGERFVAVLEIPPVDSPQSAVKVAVADEIRKNRNKLKGT